ESVPVDAAEHDWIVREGERESIVRGKLLGGPAVLVPPPALNPFARTYILCPRFDANDYLIIRRRSREIYALQHIPESERVGVRVNDSRNDGGTMQIDGLRGWTGNRLCLAIGPDEENPP